MISAIKNGVEYSLDDGVYSFFIGDEGFGMAPTHRLVERGPLQHGETDKGFRLDPRIGSLVLFIVATSRQDLYDRRDILLRIFSPGNSPLKLKWNLDDVRQIDCNFVGNMTMGSMGRAGFNQRVAITLRCPDPTFYDPEGKSKTFDLGGGSDSLVVPLTVPMVVGASTLDAINVIQYDGSWLSYPNLIRIIGPITDPIITNETTSEILDFTGTTIAGGSYYDIDLRYGYKTIVNESDVNKIADLTDDSDLATWHIAADPEVVGGANSVRVTGTSVTEATSIDLSYFERYTGR